MTIVTIEGTAVMRIKVPELSRVGKGARRLLVAVIAALWLLPLGACADDGIPASELARFGSLARIVVQNPVGETPSPPLSEALDLLLKASERILTQSPEISDAQLMKRLAPFTQRLNPEKRDLGTMEPTWFEINTARRGTLRAIAVTMGAVSRLHLVDSSARTPYRVETPLLWLYRYHQRPQFVANGSLLIVSDSVQDAGVRSGLRVDLLKQSGQRFVLQSSLKRLFVLDSRWPAAVNANGDRLIVRSIDQPKAILTSQADTHFGRVESFAIEATGLRLLSVERQDPELRAVDDWILAAKRAKQPAADQALVRRLTPEGSLLNDCKVKPIDARRLQVTVTFDEASLRFVLQKRVSGYDVLSVQNAGKGK